MLDFFFINDMHLGKRQFSEETTLQLCFAKIECLCQNGKFSPKVLKLKQLKNWVSRVFEANCRETLGHGKTENHKKKKTSRIVPL